MKREIGLKKELIIYVVLAILAIICIGGLFALKAEGDASYFSESNIEAETEYVENLKEVLSEYHMPNAGITLNRISEDGTFIEYTVMIHTGNKNSEEMIDRLESLSLAVANSSVKLVIS